MDFASLRTIRELHDAYDAGKLTPSQVTGGYLEAIAKSKLNAYLHVCRDRATQQAAEADRKLKQGKVPRDAQPLFGVPIGVKDLFAIDGVRTTCASKILENYIPPYTATAVAKLEAAGAITLGKLNMDEFAMGGSNENSAFGPVQHPSHPGYVAGGSSGGSAAAVAAGLCHAAIGTDTGGSIRLPASFCGIAGMKPTYGRVSRYGMVAFASSLDQGGPMARSVEDCATLLDVMSGADGADATSLAQPATQSRKALAQPFNWHGVRVGVPDEFGGEGIVPDVARAVGGAVQWLQSQGAEIVPVRLPHAKHVVAVYYIVAVSEASSNLARFDGVRFGYRSPEGEADLLSLYRRSRMAFGPEVKRRILLGTFALSAGYADEYYRRACQVRHLMKQDFDAAFQQADVIVGPVAPAPAFKLGAKSDPLQMYLNDLFTIPANLAGLPALSVPCGKDSQGLPIGFQMIAPALADEKLLALAGAFEKRGSA